jgi:uncharacterized membrane protein (DUF485 family)
LQVKNKSRNFSMVFRQRTSLAVKLTTLIVASAGIIFILMILFNYFYIAQARVADLARKVKGEICWERVNSLIETVELANLARS